MRAHRLAIPLLLSCLPAAAGEADSKQPLQIPRTAIEGVIVGGPEGPPPPSTDPARLEARARATPGQPIDYVGHVERVLPGGLVVLGRMVSIEWSRIQGGSREQLLPGALVRVQGRGLMDGSVEAQRVELLPLRDASAEARIREATRKFKQKYFEEAQQVDDPEIKAWIQRLGERLVPDYLPAAERQFEFFVVADPTPNAFALPDGTVVVHSGLIARMENEAQLATVLGHELAHVTGRHYVRSLENETGQKLLSIGALIAQVALAMSSDPDHRRASQGVQLISSGILSGYSRSFEDEADDVGLRYLYLAGYDVSEAPRVWGTFRRFYGDQSELDNYFYGSHSTARARESNLDFEIDRTYSPSGLMGGRVGARDFQRDTASLLRINALEEERRGWTGWAELDLRRSLEANPDDPETNLALAGFLLRQKGKDALADALHLCERAVRLAPEDAGAHRSLADVLERLGRTEAARRHLSRALELAPEAEWVPEARRQLRRLGGPLADASAG